MTTPNDYSPYAQRWLQRFADWKEPLYPELDLPDAVQRYLDHIAISLPRGNTLVPGMGLSRSEFDEHAKSLRLTRQRLMLEIMRRDLSTTIPLQHVTESMTRLAEWAIQESMALIRMDFHARFGEPEQHAAMFVIGMGKLGGRELNVSSDIDLIFAYPREGHTQTLLSTQKSISHAEFFTLFGKQLIRHLADITSEGFVFRVDMRLRPNGDAGPLAISFDMLEEYFYVQGREWERYAWIKSRVIYPAVEASAQDQHDLQQLIQPFVYRKYLDFSVIRALRSLHQQIRAQTMKKARQQISPGFDVKLGRGGIREIEFMVQLIQLLRGGHQLSLRVLPTCEALMTATKLNYLPESVAQTLSDAYRFWRQVEHRLQYIDDAQTHWLPEEGSIREKIAHSLNLPLSSFDHTVDKLQRFVRAQFDISFGIPTDQSPMQTDIPLPYDSWPKSWLEHYHDPDQAITTWCEFLDSSRFRSLPMAHQERLHRCAPELIQLSNRTPQPDTTWNRCCRLLEAVSRRGSYLSLIDEFPLAREQMVQIIAVSQWACDYLIQYPLLLDELLDTSTLHAVPDWSQYERDSRQLLSQAVLTDQRQPDIERRMDLCREQCRAAQFRILVQDLAGLLPLETVSDYLSALADRTLAICLDECWHTFPESTHYPPRFAVIAYGKLGGKELGYGGDLDLIFLYDDDHESAGARYAQLAIKLNRWLTTHTAAGILYETDYRLRPDGASGLIVSSLQAFRDYQHANHGGAWLWEHQALTRARFCVGDPAIGESFEAIRRSVIAQAREWQSLRTSVVAMREKIAQNHRIESQAFDLKHSRGGMIDVEFSVQCLVLAHAYQFPDLADNVGNIALLQRMASHGLIEPDLALQVANAYRKLRVEQHKQRLAGDNPSHLAIDTMEAEQQVIKKLWFRIFSEEINT